jgi:5-methylcytosine-specific restriction endonuclease McrA
MNCLNCQKETNNPKFCSSSCSASYTNRENPKRKKVFNKCRRCGANAPDKVYYCSKECKVAARNERTNAYSSKYTNLDCTLSDMTRRVNDASRYNQVRLSARMVYAISGEPEICSVCGYDKYVEICHVSPISSFSPSSSMKEVNSLDNLIALCPNCHKELDKGYILILRQ